MQSGEEAAAAAASPRRPARSRRRAKMTPEKRAEEAARARARRAAWTPAKRAREAERKRELRRRRPATKEEQAKEAARKRNQRAAKKQRLLDEQRRVDAHTRIRVDNTTTSSMPFMFASAKSPGPEFLEWEPPQRSFSTAAAADSSIFEEAVETPLQGRSMSSMFFMPSPLASMIDPLAACLDKAIEMPSPMWSPTPPTNSGGDRAQQPHESQALQTASDSQKLPEIPERHSSENLSKLDSDSPAFGSSGLEAKVLNESAAARPSLEPTWM